MYYVYILKSESSGKYYTGYTNNLERRLREHNQGKTKSTKNKGLFEIVYIEEFQNRKEAYKRERQIKSYKGGEAFKRLLNCRVV